MVGKLRFNAELFFTFCLMVLGVVVLIVSIGYGFGTFRRPGPGLYPFFVALIIILFSLILLILGVRAKSGEPLFTKSGLKTFSFMVITFCLWIIMMPVFGYVIMTLLVTYAFCKIMKLEGLLLLI